MWPDLELIGLYPLRFSGLYFTGKGVFHFSIDLQHHFKTCTNFQILPKINTENLRQCRRFYNLRAVESHSSVANNNLQYRLQRRADGPPLPELRPVEQVQEHEGQLRQLRRGRLHHRVVLAQLILLIINS